MTLRYKTADAHVVGEIPSWRKTPRGGRFNVRENANPRKGDVVKHIKSTSKIVLPPKAAAPFNPYAAKKDFIFRDFLS